MNILLFLFIGLFALSSLTVAGILIKKRKMLREAEKGLQLHRTELEAFALKLKAQEDNISLKKQELETKENILKKDAELLVQERKDAVVIREKLDTESEKIAEDRAILESNIREHLTKEKQLQDIALELETKSEQLALFEDSLKKSSKELSAKDLNLTAWKEEIEKRNAAIIKEREELEKRALNLNAIDDKIAAQKQEIAAREDAIKKDAEALIREREDIATIRKELDTETERITEVRAILDERTEQLAMFEERLKKTSEDLKAKDLKLTTKEEELEIYATALFREKEELNARDAELKALWDKFKSEKEEIEHKIGEIIREKENLSEEYAALKKNAQEKHEKLLQLEAELELCEEERRKAEEESRRVEEARNHANEELPSEKGTEDSGGRRLPHERGGRPRGLTDGTDQGRETKPRSLRPEIVCWKEGWSWVIGIEVPEELESLRVTQNEELLEQDNIDESRYRLKQADGIVKFTWTEGDKVLSLMESKRNYLIFKMRKNWKEPGRLVQRSTIGYYLIVAPQEWERDKEISGIAPVNPERTQLEGYKAHFFYKEQKWNNAIGFITANGERIRVESGSPRFQLVGNEINDASEDMGPLFGGPPPLIQTLDGKGWSDIGVIVVGEEGRGRNRWRTQFVPQVDVKEQKLTEELTHRHGGWYFVRIYNNDGNLLESMDFRFLTSLNDVCIENSNFLPDQNGYDNVTVRFLHQTDCKVELINKDTHHTLEIQLENGQTIVIIPPKLDCDKTHWILRNGNAEIEVTVLIERIWWALGMLGMIPTDWVDKPINLSCKDFTAITERALWLRFPRPLFTRRIDVGFDRSKIRSYQVEVEKKDLAIPLRDFCDAEEIQNPRHECFFQLFIDSQDKTYSAPLLQVPISFHCKNCKFVTNSEQEARSHLVDHLSDLIPHLRYEELRQIFGESLPHTIYKCSYCNYYISSHDPRNPTSTICSHIEDECQKAVRENGIIKKRFSVVSDVNEIRENVITNLPRIFRCRVCSKEFQGDNIELRTIHLQEKHKKELFEIL